MVETECTYPELLLQEGEYTTVLSEARRYRLTAGQLELRSEGGDTLVFRSRR